MRVLTLAAAGILLALAGCSPGAAPPAGPTTPGTDGTGSLGTATDLPAPPTSEPPGDGEEYRVSYPFGVPASTVTVTNPGAAPNLPRLVAVYAADHPEGDPAYQRVSFYFRGGFPSYRFGYVPSIVQDGSGDPVALDGGYFLSLVFDGAQAHDDTGSSTVARSPARPLDYSALLDLAPAGDFEGQVSYGLGVAEAGDTAPAVRLGELKRTDGSGGFYYVVHVDVRAG